MSVTYVFVATSIGETKLLLTPVWVTYPVAPSGAIDRPPASVPGGTTMGAAAVPVARSTGVTLPSAELATYSVRAIGCDRHRLRPGTDGDR